MERNYILPVLTFLLLTGNVYGQEKFRLSDAIAMALEKNYDVQLSKAGRAMAAENNHAGNAGMLPSVVMEGGYNRTDLNLSQTLADGRIIERDAATSENISAAARLTWTLFDGMGMFIRKSRLESLSREAELTLRLQMENSIQQVIAAYFAVQVIEQRIKSLQELMKVDSIRVQLAVVRLEGGNGNKLDLLQARLDNNTHKSQLLQEKANLNTAQENLNLLLGRDPMTAFTTTDPFSFQQIQADESTRETDTRLRLASQREQTAIQWMKEVKSGRLPVLTFNAAYTYNETDNEAGFLLQNRNTGPGFGLTLQWNLFNGFRTSQAVKAADLEYTMTRLRKEQELLLRKQTEEKLRRDYSLQLELARTAELSHSFAQEILIVATERLKNGLSTALEITEAQRNFEDATTRLYEARYQAKLTETEILKITGKLIAVLP